MKSLRKIDLIAGLAVWLVLPAVMLNAALPEPPPRTKWLTYIDTGRSYKIRYPYSWEVLTKGNAVVITSPGGPDQRGVFGITPRPEGANIDDAVAKEFADPDRSSDLMQSPARIANMQAIKVWGSKKGDPSIRIVEYYVQNGPQQYYILFQAPHATMIKYTPVFNAMIQSMIFLK